MNKRRHGRLRRMRRAAISLVEIVIVISIMGTLMSLGVVLLGLLLRSDTAGHRALATQLSVSRLEHQFRADAHDAVTAVAADDAASLELQLYDGRRAVWTITGAGVERRVVEGESQSVRDEYRLAEGPARFDVAASGRMVEFRQSRRLSTPTETPAEFAVSPRQEWRIQGALGIAVVPAAATVPITPQEP